MILIRQNVGVHNSRDTVVGRPNTVEEQACSLHRSKSERIFSVIATKK
jgi:hypothetical protein